MQSFLAAVSHRATDFPGSNQQQSSRAHDHDHSDTAGGSGDHNCRECQRAHGSEAMHALIDAFNDAFNAPAPAEAVPAAPAIPTPSSGPPPLGSILQLAKETGMPRKACKAALFAHSNDYAAARWSLLPSEQAGSDDAASCEMPTTQAAIDGVFDPCPKFAGGRAGWIYKSGQLGVGYYRDAPLQVAVASQQGG